MSSSKGAARQREVEATVRRLSATQGESDKKYRLTQVGSEIGGTQRQRQTLKTLGLRHRGAEAEVRDNPVWRGRIRAVAHLLHVEEV